MVLIAHSPLLVGAICAGTLKFAGETLHRIRSSASSAGPAFDGHWHTKPGPQRDERPGIHLVSGLQVKAILLGECRHTQLCFDKGELIADAAPRARAERDERKLRPVGASFRQKAFGIERLRIAP